MSKKSGRSEEKTDWLGNKSTHYDTDDKRVDIAESNNNDDDNYGTSSDENNNASTDLYVGTYQNKYKSSLQKFFPPSQ